MRLPVVGAKSILGMDMLQGRQSDDVIAADLAVPTSGTKLKSPACVRVRPDWIVLTAAYADVDGSENNRDPAFAVNGTGAANVARFAAEFGDDSSTPARDYVFDGKCLLPFLKPQ